ncbi:PfkB family carbohydrate kinase [Methylobacillus arboreus]|uniref:PfkB family carbohydrate kinase n=1 Tax=Methylobacillus arboreus TaxID=755170 RepID=UPI001E40BBBA|nr:PfkB family carbohydrate kinase [Methylobacillus arboreus]MCB5190501.1 PfkB family carbohydrate kinase [Methylobacillus arboreus]
MLASFKPTASSAYVLASLMIAQIYFVRRFPVAGESLQADDFYCETGGKGLNVLVGLHKLGVPVRGIIPCGRNHISEQQCADIIAQWQLNHISRAATAEYNGNGVALIDAQGQNQIIVHSGANALLDATHIQQEASAIAQADLVYAPFELPDAAIMAAFSIARVAGRITVLNPSPYREISPDLLALTDVLIMNQTEAQAWLHIPQDKLSTRESALAWLYSMQFNQRFPGKSLIMTLGCQGAIAILEDGSTRQQAGFDTEVIDSIGAGDAFASAMLASLLQGHCIDTALLHGCASASLLVRARGLLSNLPTSQTLQYFLSGQASSTN